MAGGGVGVAELEHGAPLVVGHRGSIVDTDRVDAEEGQAAGWPVVSARQFP